MEQKIAPVASLIVVTNELALDIGDQTREERIHLFSFLIVFQ
jgi:hypothetical protein